MRPVAEWLAEASAGPASRRRDLDDRRRRSGGVRRVGRARGVGDHRRRLRPPRRAAGHPEELWHPRPFEPTASTGELLLGRGAARTTRARSLFHTLGLRAPGSRDRPRARPRSTSSSSSRARRRAARRTSAALLRGQPRAAGLRRRRGLRHRHVGRDTPTICTGMRGMIDCAGRPARPRRRPALRLVRRRGAQPDHRDGAGARRLHDADGQVTVPASTTASSRSPTANASCSRKLPFDEASWLRHAREPGDRTARPATRHWSGSGRGRPPRSTGSRVATPARATRRSCPATRTRSSRSGSWPTRTRSRSRTAAGLRRGQHPGRDHRDACTSTARACGRA